MNKDSTFFPPRSSSSFFSGYSSRFNPFHSTWRAPTYVRLLTSYVVDPALCVFVSLSVPGERVRLSVNMPRYK